MVHSVKKALKDYGDKVSADEKTRIEAAITETEAAIKSGDKAEIEAKTQALAEASHKLAEQMYAKEQAAGGQPGGDAGGDTGARAGRKDDDVVDAEFEEVKDK